MKSLIPFLPLIALTGCAFSPPAAQATPPTTVLEWNQVTLDAIARGKPTQHQAVRLLAYVSIAQHAAITSTGPGPARDDAIATASAQVIAALLPSQAAPVDEHRRRTGRADSGVGRRVAEKTIGEAANDGFSTAWTGSVPAAAYAWRSLASPPAAPAYAAVGSMRTFFLASGSALRPPPPPVLGSTEFRDALAEVRRTVSEPTPESMRLAKFYDMTTGTLVGGFWNERARALIDHEPLDDRKAAKVLASLNMTMMDALVACHDAKYVYWVPRPTQADPALEPLIGVPNHPSYPSNHSCISTAAGRLLGHFFPSDEAALARIATDAGLSRIHAGLHYRFDVVAGEAIGRQVATAGITRHAEVLDGGMAVAVR